MTSFACQYCGAEHYAPMLQDAVWLSTAKDPRGLVCTPCMEEKLGRSLRVVDLKPVPMNDGIRHVLAKLEAAP